MNIKLSSITETNIQKEADMAMDNTNTPETATAEAGHLEAVYGGGTRFVMRDVAFDMLLDMDSLQSAVRQALCGITNGTTEAFLEVFSESEHAVPVYEFFVGETGKFMFELREATVKALTRSDTAAQAELADVLVHWNILPERLAELYRATEEAERLVNDLAEKARGGSDIALVALLTAKESCLAMVADIEKLAA
ncbi:hypothetical protein IQ03_00006 [Gemmobacter caeni]|uniref:Uncharacterized protein n=2 Tax=Gemmobacter TaxID=204456 RepID=A0A2T6BAP0_9RHOB|nr:MULTISPECIES: hypothetical protein [Gemmobacter]PTX53098.1 hypothetical protein C8N34_1018 [Gemmobacter caeni]TWJ05209.1 hypothetical protein IQ03_00006 [Gemmobacter caeni]GHC17392.1 hypothetical protein GCM10007291_15200 [Gemmobacter nanjingensis]